MKISISYPPINVGKGVPLLSQNRQFQYFNRPTYIYPVVPAYAATLLKQAGHCVIWDDAIAEETNYETWLKEITRKQPDLIAIETKTPVVKKHWSIINQLKNNLPETKIILMGDHVTALPLESFENSKVDIVITGGNYDFSLLNIADWLDNNGKLESGVYYRTNGGSVSTGKSENNHNLNLLPFINRDITKWSLYAYNNGNYKRTPGTYTMVGRDCWWRNQGGCTFCSWPTLYPNFKTRKPESLIEEIGMLIERYKVKEVFDDTGTFPVGQWLRKFCELMIENKYNERISFSCNIRFGTLTKDDYQLMKRAGFRLLLFGVESANQKTLDRLNKGTIAKNIEAECRTVRKTGLEPHITVMIGYPWESRKDAESTLDLAKRLMGNGSAVTLQSTIVTPYPGTKLYDEASKNDWFRIDPRDYDKFDMKEPVLVTPDMSPEEVMEICDSIYKVFLSPRYLLKHFARVRSWRDIHYTLRGAVKVLGHVKDFAKD